MASRIIRVCDRTGKEFDENDPVYQIHGMKITDADGNVVFEFEGWEEVSPETMEFCKARMEQVALKPKRGRRAKAASDSDDDSDSAGEEPEEEESDDDEEID